eukprot:TRINITY_DN3627_c0_g3_i1.p1 TRINITY_DN3627_c0_g3~~TRINITY_DN3627_c0_g3_i1.p1  ORF type:complete len:1049 (+),score=297.10 TRINITY_DN3627_c0_g3_i1:362-3508(+)
MARPPSSAQKFEEYFQKADLDRDGRITGSEAVAFFQGANLPQQKLALIWNYADQNKTGFLGRAEFYNALKLVTVAQSGRELTPDLVRAALFGPASSQIPAPVIVGPPARMPSVLPTSAPVAAPSTTGSLGVAPSNASIPTAQPRPVASGYASSANNQFMQPQPFPRSPTPTLQNPVLSSPSGVGMTVQQSQVSVSPRELPAQKVSGSLPTAPISGVSVGQSSQIRMPAPVSLKQDAPGQASSGFPSGAVSLTNSRSMSDNVKPSFPGGETKQTSSLDGNGFSADSVFSKNAFSASSFSTAISPTSMSISTQTKQIQVEKPQSLSTVVPPTGLGSVPTTAGAAPQVAWPKMTQSNARIYAKTFAEVDTDRDGKITGQQARDLFLSWKLPREVLKQVWDLSDQDGDSMLSLREFCIALYLMERFREGRPLPQVLPSGIFVDEALKSIAGLQRPSQQAVGPNGIPWQQNAAMFSQGARYGTLPPNMVRYPTTPRGESGGAQTVANHLGHYQITQGDASGAPMTRNEAPVLHSELPKSQLPGLEANRLNQLSRDEQEIVKSKYKDAEEAEKKVHALEKDIMDAKEKLDFYRSKLQELILYKTRCDNRINEITARAAADKREVEAMAKKYEDKYKQSGESNSRLASEEAAFKDIQERKIELYNAILRMEQTGKADGLLQTKADRIQKDLEELWKALKARCKQLSLRTKPTTVMEMPFGWQPGIQDKAAEWDDDWDKFEDEGFVLVQELVNENPMPKHSEKDNSESALDDTSSVDEDLELSSATVAGTKDDNLPSSEHINGNEQLYSHSEDGSPKTMPGSPPHDTSKPNNLEDVPAAKQTQSDHISSSNAGDLFGEAASWDAPFTTGSENDSFWNFDKDLSGSKDSLDIGASRTTFDDSHDRHLNNPTFDSLDSFNNKTSSSFGALDDDSPNGFGSFPPIRTTQPVSFSFDNSVPSTPIVNSLSPGRHSNAGSFDDHSSQFDSFARFDSLNPRDSGVFSTHDPFVSFDSFKAKDDGHSRPFASFDDSDPFGSSGPFSAGVHTPKHKSADAWSAF